MKIMLVDDNKECCDSLSTLFTFMGHETLLAYDGPEAINSVVNFFPELILLDINLPTMTGWEVAEHMMRLPHLNRSIICALTAFGQPSDYERSAKIGMKKHFVKPLQIVLLREFLSEHGIKL